jgi:hypothetical protein
MKIYIYNKYVITLILDKLKVLKYSSSMK